MTIKNKTTNIYTEWKPLIDGLSNEEAGKVFKCIFQYQSNEEVKCSNPVWLFIKSKIDEYNTKGEQISEKRRENGKLGGLAKASKCWQMLANDGKSSNKTKENKIKQNNKNEELNKIIDDIKDDVVRACIKEWIQYKKEKKDSYTPSGLKKCISRLQKLSGGNPTLAQEIVDSSMANGYSGLFLPKGNVGPKPTQAEEVFNHNFAHLQSLFEGEDNAQ